MSYKQISNSFLPTWKPAKMGDEIEGYYTDKKTNQGKNKNSTLYTLLTRDGDIQLWGSVILNSNFDSVPMGAKVKIIYQGKAITKSGNEVNKFDFYCDDSDKIKLDILKDTSRDVPEPEDEDFPPPDEEGKDFPLNEEPEEN